MTVKNKLCPGKNQVLLFITGLFLLIEPPFLLKAQSTISGSQATRQVIIFKFDDLRESTQSAFQKAADIITRKECKAGFGIVGNSCEGNGEKETYFNRIKNFNNTGRIEIWAHGYDHFMRGDTLTEFRNMPYQHQYEHFKKTLDLVYEKFGIIMHTFGTPGNKSDSTTNIVINQFPQIEVYLFPFLSDTTNKQLLLKSRVDMEQGVGNINYEYFVKNYTERAGRPYMVLQGHPAMWKEEGFNTFGRIIDFLRTKGIDFMTPYEYCKSLKP